MTCRSLGRWLVRWVGCTVLVPVLLTAAVAGAQPRVGLLRFEGPGAGRARSAVVHVIQGSRRFELVPAAKVLHASRALHANLEEPAGRAAVGTELSLRVLVGASSRRSGKGYELSVRVYEAGSGALYAQQELRGSPAVLARGLRRWLLPQLREVQQRVAAPAAPPAVPPQEQGMPDALAPAAEPESEPQPARIETPPPSAAPARASEDDVSAPVPSGHTLELELAPYLLARSLAYERAWPALLQLRLQPTPGLGLRAQWYPAARADAGLLSQFGVELYANGTLPVDVVWGSSRFPTRSFALGADLRLRIPVAAQQLGVFAGGGVDALWLEDSQYGERPRFAGVTYEFARLGLDARVSLTTRFSVDARAAYLFPSAYGQLRARFWFPHASGGFGLQAELGASYALSQVFTLRVGLAGLRYRIQLHTQADDPGVVVFARAASAAVDQSVQAFVSVRVHP